MSKDKQEQHQPADLPATDFTGGWPHLGPPENYYANYFFASCDDKESAVLSELGWSLPEVQLSGPSHSDRLGDLVKEEERPGLAGSTENIAEDDTGVRSSDDAAFASRPCGDVPTSRSNPSASSDSSEEDRTEKPTGSSGQNLSAETPNKVQKRGQKRLKQPRFAFMTKSEVDNLEDGYRWRKYGQKAVKNSPFPRSYYRCTNSKCTVKKRVERSSNDPAVVITTYEGQHCHHTAGFLRGGVISNDLAAFGHHPARPFPQIYSSNATAAVRFPIGAPPNLKSYHVQTSSETERQQLGSFIRGTTSSAEHKPYFSLDH